MITIQNLQLRSITYSTVVRFVVYLIFVEKIIQYKSTNLNYD
jgi:hypothetical protein